MHKIQTLTAWYSLIMGALGFHRFYLYGWRDIIGWLCFFLSCVGIMGVSRMLNLGQDDRISWLMLPILGCTIIYGCATAIYIALMPVDRWHTQYAPNSVNRGMDTEKSAYSLLPAIFGLLMGCGVFLATISFSIQKLFELMYS